MFGIEESPVCVGRYELSHALGDGAMGVVYAARDTRLDRAVAIKLLRPEIHQEAARLEREARALARLSHPHVVTVHEVGEHEQRTFLVMEMITGRNLRAWLTGTRTLAERLEVLRQAALGLAAAHRLGIVHRDFKPENAIVGDDGRLRIVDFGLALEAGEVEAAAETTAPARRIVDGSRITSHGRLMGTPAYMAPELLDGVAPSPRSDQYALCCVAWELLFGEHPRFSRGAAVPAVRVDRKLQQALRRGLSARPEDRHADMAALIEAFSPRRQRPRVIVFVTTAAVVLVAGYAAVRLVGSKQPPAGVREPTRAEAASALAAVIDDVHEMSSGTSHENPAAPGACAREPAFDRPRRDLEHSRARLQVAVDGARAAGRASAPELLEGLAEVELALGLREPACERLRSLGPGRTEAGCWRAAYCLGEGLPNRARCFGGDRDACATVAIKHEYEMLAAQADAKAKVHDQAEVLASAHLGFLVEVLEQGCALGDAAACEQRDGYLPAVAPR
nr:serine/threonine-protein kinase [Nannocystis sp. SCPEA4]